MENRKARFDYIILETLSAGLALKGSEVKSLRSGLCQLKDSYVVFRKTEAFLQNMHISAYKHAGQKNHDPERRRKLLLTRAQLNRLEGQIHQKGLSCVPLKVYFKKNLAKVDLALVKGKKQRDKRQALKKKEIARQAQQAFRKSRR